MGPQALVERRARTWLGSPAGGTRESGAPPGTG